MLLTLLQLAATVQDPASVVPPGATIDQHSPTPWAGGRDAAWAPFAPRASPDHVVVMVGDGPRREYRTVRRHGDWARVESGDLHGASTWLVSLRDPVALSFRRAADGRYDQLYIRLPDGGEAGPPVRPTGDRDQLLGETCAVWDVTARVMSGSSRDARWLSCVTDDGIELWNRYESSRGYRTGMRAVSISREPVRPEMVTPPDDLLDPERWAIDWPRDGEESVEVIMDNGRDDAWRREARYRRVGEVVRRDEPGRIDVRNRTETAFFSFVRDRDGRYRSLTFGVREEGALTFGPPELADETRFPPLEAAGERCVWSHMTPGVADYARWECLTPEGDMLAHQTQTRGFGARFTPVAVSRGLLEPSSVRPPTEVIDPANWGLD